MDRFELTVFNGEYSETVAIDRQGMLRELTGLQERLPAFEFDNLVEVRFEGRLYSGSQALHLAVA